MTPLDLNNSHSDVLPHDVYRHVFQMIFEEVEEAHKHKTVQQIINRILMMLEENLFLNMGRVLLPDNTDNFLRIRYSHGLSTEKRFITYTVNEGITGFIYHTGQAMYIDDLDTNSMYIGRLVNPMDLPYSKPAFSGVPIFNPLNDVIGVLCVNHGYRNRMEVKTTLGILEQTAQIIGELLATQHELSRSA